MNYYRNKKGVYATDADPSKGDAKISESDYLAELKKLKEAADAEMAQLEQEASNDRRAVMIAAGFTQEQAAVLLRR